MPIAMALLDSHTERSGQSVTLSPDAAQALMRYDWPGNVRELENEMMRASVLAEGKLVKPRHLSAKTIRRGSGAALAPSAGTTMGWDGEASLEDVVARVERSVIEQALRAHRGKKAPVARVLGISRPGLDAKIRRHEIDVQALKKSPLLVAGLTTS
jgi:DNA-binding NtrC family response regulator